MSDIQTTTPAPPVPITKETDLVRRAKQFKDYAEAFACNSEADFEMLGLMVERSAEGIKDAESTFGEPKRLSRETWLAIVAKEKAVVDPFTEGRLILDRKGIAYKQALQAARMLEQAKVDAAAREANRIAQEERDKVQAALEESTTNALREELGKALAEGATAAELEAIERHAPPPEVLPPVVMQPPVLVIAPPSTGGPTVLPNWQAKITDEHALLGAAADNGFVRNLWKNPKVLEAMTGVLTALAKKMGKTLEVPGVVVQDVGSLRAGKKVKLYPKGDRT